MSIFRLMVSAILFPVVELIVTILRKYSCTLKSGETDLIIIINCSCPVKLVVLSAHIIQCNLSNSWKSPVFELWPRTGNPLSHKNFILVMTLGRRLRHSSCDFMTAVSNWQEIALCFFANSCISGAVLCCLEFLCSVDFSIAFFQL